MIISLLCGSHIYAHMHTRVPNLWKYNTSCNHYYSQTQIGTHQGLFKGYLKLIVLAIASMFHGLEIDTIAVLANKCIPATTSLVQAKCRQLKVV